MQMPIPSILWNQHGEQIVFAGFKPDGSHDWCLAEPGMFGVTATGYVFVEALSPDGEASLVSVDIPFSIVEDGVHKEFTGWIVRGEPDFVAVDMGHDVSTDIVVSKPDDLSVDWSTQSDRLAWSEAFRIYRHDPKEKVLRKRLQSGLMKFMKYYAPFAAVNDAIVPGLAMIDDFTIPVGAYGFLSAAVYTLGRVRMIQRRGY